MPGSGRPFAKGNQAGPGRRRGIKEVVPRGFIKRLVFRVIGKHEKAIEAALTRAATSPKSVIAFLDYAAKLNKEIGRGDAAGSAPTIINFPAS